MNKTNKLVIATLGLFLFMVVVWQGYSFNSTVAAAPAERVMSAQTIDAANGGGINYSGFKYLRTSGTTFKPRANYLVNWGYGGAGCMYSTSGGELFNHAIQLPDTARIDYIRLYYYDTDATFDGQVWITSYNAQGNTDDFITVTTTGSSGYGSVLSDLGSEIVNSAGRAYVLNWRSNVDGAGVQICGVRIAYRMPLDNFVYLPLVRRKP